MMQARQPVHEGRNAVMDFIIAATAKQAVTENPFVPFTSLHIHPTNLCNARCVFCAYQYNKDKKQFMSLSTFKAAIDSYVAIGGRRLYLTPNAGEPLVDAGFIEKLRYAKAVGVGYIGFVTNGILLKRNENYRRLLPLVDNIGISLPGLDRSDYLRLYGVDRATQVYEGILSLAMAKKEMRLKTEILLLFRIDRPLVKVMEDSNMKKLMPYIEDGTLVIDDDILTNVDDWGGQISADLLPGEMSIYTTDKIVKPIPCSRLLSDVAVLPDGAVRVCACRYIETNYDSLVIGQIHDEPLENIIFGKAHKELLRSILDGGIPPVCRTCNWYTEPKVALSQK